MPKLDATTSMRPPGRRRGQVAALEAAAGRPLFERAREGARPTPAGRRLLDRARTVLAQLEAARRELDAAAPAAGPVLARLPRGAAEGVDLVSDALRSAAYGLVVDSV